MLKERFAIFVEIRRVLGIGFAFGLPLVGLRLAIVAMLLWQPFIYKLFIEDVLLAGDLDSFWIVCLEIAFLGVAVALLRAAEERQMTYTRNVVSLRARMVVMSRLMKTRTNETEKISFGEKHFLFSEGTKSLGVFVEKQIFGNLVLLIRILLLVAVMFSQSVLLTTLCLIFFCLAFLQSGFLKKHLDRKQTVLNELRNQVQSNTQAWIEGWKEVKSLGAEHEILTQFRKGWNGVGLAFARVRVQEYFNIYFSMLNYDLISKVFLYAAGGFLVFSGSLEISAFVVYLGFYEVLNNAMSEYSEIELSFAQEKNRCRRVLEFCARSGGQCDRIPLPQRDALEVWLQEVSYSYPNSSLEILNSVSYKFVAGKKYLLRGGSGVGKSSLLKLICGEVEATAGRVFIGGVDVRESNELLIYKRTAYVRQGARLFNLSVLENLRLAKHNASEEEAWDVLRMVELEDTINALPQMLHSRIGENGNLLSGGQRQRLTLARCFLTRPGLVLIDEATSAVDFQAEARILRRMFCTMPESTFILVSHRAIDIEELNVIELSRSCLAPRLVGV